jgi:hypothetical protein
MAWYECGEHNNNQIEKNRLQSKFDNQKSKKQTL